MFEVRLLSSNFTPAEIDTIMERIGGCKSMGQDGFKFSFYKFSWDVMKYEIYVRFDQFYLYVLLPKSLASFFVTLIPKVDPLGVKDFRHIYLLGSFYKFIGQSPCG